MVDFSDAFNPGQGHHLSSMKLIFDFDGTITVNDTIGDLAQAAIAFQEDRHGKHLQAAWDKVVEDYLKDCKAYKDSYRPSEGERRSVSEELRFLSGLKHVEEASLDRVEQSGVFSGLRREDLFRMGMEKVKSGEVSVRDGFRELVELAEQKGWTVCVLSVNWSRAFIEGVLHPHKIPVIANQVSEEDGKIQGPEYLGGRLTNCSDKAKCLSHQLAGQQQQQQQQQQQHTGTTTLYFGDSTTDMECLLHQRGVVISAEHDSSPLLQTLYRVGIRVPHVDGSLHDEANIYWARDFREVLHSDVLEQSQ